MPDESSLAERRNKLLTAPEQKYGPMVGTIIVLVLLLIGALYFGIDRLQKERKARNQISYIPNGTTTVTVIKTATSTPSR